MNSILTVLNASPTQDLTILESVKRELHIATTAEDQRLSQWIKQASQVIANHCNRVFALETVRETLRVPANNFYQVSTNNSIVLRRFPIAQIISVTENGIVLTSDEYTFDPAAGILSRLNGDTIVQWPRLKIIVDYTTGYELLQGLPFDIERACISLVRQIRSQSTRDPLAKRIEVPDVSMVEYWVGQVGQNGAMPPDVVDLLAPYVCIRI